MSDGETPIQAETSSTPLAAQSSAAGRFRSLTPVQQTALAALSEGQTIRDAATAAGIHRVTLGRWLKTDPAFRAGYNAWREELINSTRGRLLHTAVLAAAVVHKAIEKGDGRLAMALLDRLGLAAAASAVPTATDAELARDEIAVEREEEAQALNARIRKVCSALSFQPYELRFADELRKQAQKLNEPSDPAQDSTQ
jgi:hypothetical protein